MPEMLLTIPNRHNDPAPRWEARPGDGRYYGYFENAFGEQWVFVYDMNAERGVLSGGDLGWDGERRVQDDGQVPGLILNELERMWLRACWSAATAGREFREQRRNER
jgi:hypothetical protein